ncbi:hypothetical protein GCM10010399_00180 [Dactylosporangium fulvum]
MRTAREMLAGAHTIAVVGASRDPQKPAHWVPKLLQDQGWRIIPVNPHADQVFGEQAYARLVDIPVHVDLVDVFRPAPEAPELVREAAAIGAGGVWLQPGIASPQARQAADDAGLEYVENTCIGTERALAQMVVGGTTPRSEVYRGLSPQAELEVRPLVRHHRIGAPGAEQHPVRLSTAAPWLSPKHRAVCRSAPRIWTEGRARTRICRIRARYSASVPA